MDWLNYHHLFYFWTVARVGSVTRASSELRLAQPTVSAQLRALESSLGTDLFVRSGRALRLTEAGEFVFRYADQIFSLGRELMDGIKGETGSAPMRLVVGVAEGLPKMVAYRLLEPALSGEQHIRLICTQGPSERLLADLAVHAVDLVLTDAPIGHTIRVKAFNHLLGECGVTLFGSPQLAAAYRRGFPRSLDGAPLLLPGKSAVLRRAMQQWLEDKKIRPSVVHEIHDSALLKVLGQAGIGLFVAPTAVEAEVCRQYGVRAVGRIETIRERFYAISTERKVRHPSVVAICETARRELFA